MHARYTLLFGWQVFRKLDVNSSSSISEAELFKVGQAFNPRWTEQKMQPSVQENRQVALPCGDGYRPLTANHTVPDCPIALCASSFASSIFGVGFYVVGPAGVAPMQPSCAGMGTAPLGR